LQSPRCCVYQPLKKLAQINSKFIIKNKRKKPAFGGGGGEVLQGKSLSYIVSTFAKTLSKGLVPNLSNARIERDEGFNNVPYYIENCQNLFIITTLDS